MHTADSLTLESLAYLKAVHIARLQKVLIVGDCRIAIESIQEKAQPPWKATHLISKIQHENAVFTFAFIRRKQNQTARELYQWAKNYNLKSNVSIFHLHEKATSSLDEEDVVTMISNLYS
ncbi:hypothetical protein Ancab_000245 [Ancistrocladus abbreviatus]